MAYTQFTEDMEILQKENDRPNALGNPKRSAADMKGLFDEAGIKIKDYLNNTLLPELDNTAGDLATDEAAIAQNATDIVALKAKKRFVYADADIAYNTTTTTSILKAKLHPSGEVGDYVIGKNGGVAVIVSQLDATRWNITTQQMSVRPPYSASQIGYSSQSEIYQTSPADVEEALAGLEGNVEGLINDVESLETSVTDLEARTKLVYYTGVIDTTKSTSTDQTGYLPNYKPNDDIIPGDCFIDDYGSIGVVTAISGTTVTYRYTGEKFNGLAENVLYGSLSPIYPAAPGNVSQALSGLEGVAETLVDDVDDLKAEASFVFFEGEISTTSTVLSQYSTTSHFYPIVKSGCYFVDSKGAVGRVLGVSGTDVVFVFSGMRVLPTAPEFSSVTVQDSSGGVTLDGTYIDGDPVLGLSETGDDDLPVRVMNVATPTLGTDAANKAYVDAQSGSATPAAVVTATGAMISEQKAQTRENLHLDDYVTPEMFGADGTAAKDHNAIVSAVNSGKVVVFEQGKTYYTDGKITIPVGAVLIGNNAKVIKTNADAIGFEFSGNNYVESLTVNGNKGQAQSASENYHNFKANGSNISFYNCVSVDANGDGFYINGDNVSLVNCMVDNPNRNCITVINGEGLFIDNCRLTNATSLGPKYGIDLEPNLSTETIQGTIQNIFTSGNLGGSISLSASNTSANLPWNIVIQNVVSESDGNSALQTGNFVVSIVVPLCKTSRITIDNFTVNNVESKALYIAYPSGITDDCNIKIHNFIVNGCQMSYPITLLTNSSSGHDVRYLEIEYHVFNRSNSVDYDVSIVKMSDGNFSGIHLTDLHNKVPLVLNPYNAVFYTNCDSGNVPDYIKNGVRDYLAENVIKTFTLGKSSSKIVQFNDAVFACFIFVQARALSLYKSWILQGYGPGDSRYHLTSLSGTTADISATISGDTLILANANASNDCTVSVMMVMGSIKSISNPT